MTLLLTILCFLSGSLMFSYWLGLLKNKNIRTVGDGNPGAANLWKAAGYKYGLAGIALDFLKGYLPVLIILKYDWAKNGQMIPIALAPIAGHAFSPFLKFRGGKSLAVSFGVWSALTAFRVAVAYAFVLAVFFVVTHLLKRGKPVSSDEDGFQTTLGMLLLSFYLYYRQYPAPILWIWFGNFALLFYKNKAGIVRVLKHLSNKEEKQFPI
jgi:glycerol-3-phosphate acyltransferase PlsY